VRGLRETFTRPKIGFSLGFYASKTKPNKNIVSGPVPGLHDVVLADAVAVVVFQLAEDDGGKNG
jgi:hypothetical protein